MVTKSPYQFRGSKTKELVVISNHGKKIFLLAFVLVAYLLYARFVLNPHLYKNFSLIDDGQSIKNGYYLRECMVAFKCENFKTQIQEQATGQSRLFYWISQSLLYQKPLINAEFQHLFRIYFFGSLMVILLSTIALLARASPLAIVLGMAIFITNYSFSENIIRLGPAEPYQVILLALFSLIYLNSDMIKKRSPFLYFFSATILLTLLFSIKETSIIVLPAVLVLWALFPKKNNIKEILLIFILPTLLFLFVGKPFSEIQNVEKYASNYHFSPSIIIQNAKYFISATMVLTSPFLKIMLLLLAIPLIFKKLRKQIYTKNLLYWLLLFASLTVVYFPWKYVLDRYLLPAIFCFSISFGILLSAYLNLFNKVLIRKNNRLFFYLGFWIILVGLFLRGAPVNFARTVNYRDWFITFTQFEGDQVREIAKFAQKETVYLNAKDNIENMEVLYEIPLHLKYFYGPEYRTARVVDRVPTKGYLFSRSSFEPVLPLEKIQKYELVASENYAVKQIDPFAFRVAFNKNPLKATQDLPYYKDNVLYYWEIRKLK